MNTYTCTHPNKTPLVVVAANTNAAAEKACRDWGYGLDPFTVDVQPAAPVPDARSDVRQSHLYFEFREALLTGKVDMANMNLWASLCSGANAVPVSVEQEVTGLRIKGNTLFADNDTVWTYVEANSMSAGMFPATEATGLQLVTQLPDLTVINVAYIHLDAPIPIVFNGGDITCHWPDTGILTL